jgi:aminopeptidase N
VTDQVTGTVTTGITTGPAREFAMTLLPTSGNPAETKAGDATVRVTLPEDQQIPGLAAFMADTAAQTLTLYETWMGDYPSGEFDITVAPLSGANGVSWSGMTWFDLHPITADGELSDQEKVGLAFVILHEVGHQWIADIIGCNNNDHGFMSEGLVNALAVLAAEELFGQERANLYLQSWVAGPYTSLLNDGRDGIADATLTNDTNGVIRSLLIYGKAAIGFIALWEEIGAAAFMTGLADYGTEFRFGISEPADLLAAFEGASGESLDDLGSFWFNEQQTTRADVTTVLAEFGEGIAIPAG